MSPRVDVIIPCHNCGGFLEQTLASIDGQHGDFEVAEIVIVNDRSSDMPTIELLARLSEDGRIRVIENQGPKGAAAARNTGLRATKADWIIFLDGDDLLTPGSIQQRIAVLDSHPDIGWIGGDITLINAEGEPEAESFFRSRPRPREALQQAWVREETVIYRRPVEMFIEVCVSGIGASLVRRDLLERVGGFREHLWQAEDYQLWIRLARIADFAFLPHTVLLYRQHGSNTMATDIPPRLWTIRAFEQLLKDPLFTPFRLLLKGRIAQFHIENGWYFRGKHSPAQAALSYARSFLVLPSTRSLRSLTALAVRPTTPRHSDLGDRDPSR
ncbi:MAG: glycosyltransferase family A protein [Halieaceae bacterium]|jgi:glycosyltransferase involved in cell wall biosynthesis|nr:glycosyltransferase family A protein [Halieaceae bacterium]